MYSYTKLPHLAATVVKLVMYITNAVQDTDMKQVIATKVSTSLSNPTAIIPLSMWPSLEKEKSLLTLVLFREKMVQTSERCRHFNGCLMSV